MSYREVLQADIRLRLLQALTDAPEYTLPEMALQDALAAVGHRLSSDALAVETAWLDETGLAARLAVGMTAVVTITRRGLDVAAGRASVPGVARPRPGE